MVVGCLFCFDGGCGLLLYVFEVLGVWFVGGLVITLVGDTEFDIVVGGCGVCW